MRFPVSFKRYFHTSQGWLQAKRRLNWLCRSASLPCRVRLAPPCLHRFGPSPCPGYYSRHWANMASADSCLFTTQVALHGAGKIPVLSAFLGFVSPLQAKALSWKSRDIWVPVAPAGNLTKQESIPHQRQVSPDKNVNLCYTTAAFTLSPEPRALTCCADLSGN